MSQPGEAEVKDAATKAADREAAKEAKKLAKEAKFAKKSAAAASSHAASSSSSSPSSSAAAAAHQAPPGAPIASSEDSSREKRDGVYEEPSRLFSNVADRHPRSHDAFLASKIGSTHAPLHPSIIRLSFLISTFNLMGASARTIGVLGAFKDVVRDYRTPKGAVLSRDLIGKLAPQINALVHARPLGQGVAHAIRYLKYEVSLLDPSLAQEQAKQHIISRIDHFIRDRIILASTVIQNVIYQKLRAAGEVVLTYGRSSVVEASLISASSRGKSFRVIVVDSGPLYEGRRTLASLLEAGIQCEYALLNSLPGVIGDASLAILGTASLLADGSLYARAGTASVALIAHAKGVPSIVACETFKFSERVQLDALVGNEAGDPLNLLSFDSAAANPRLRPTDLQAPNLGVKSLLYDLTPARYITAVASEVGLNGPESVGVILRDYKSTPWN
ncbi:Translation initiation factor 2B, delta subunit (eIF-2Bdelta/GCD2) [Ceraceosorus bombacis]|uniref:Translation initiation factor eIF2B subunit delta n=1 Tax=Ceraceosorus bombacis TaxID=401625 RepID=A0A0N7L929_9BASI|nr:Translation initiation factor 2B, delta subunit (eIF-2Bdelta/GCD2) [Ceraceosorus bombacis]